jgi:hypothetical protein
MTRHARRIALLAGILAALAPFAATEAEARQSPPPTPGSPAGALAGRGVEPESLPALLAQDIPGSSSFFRDGPAPAAEVGLLRRLFPAQAPDGLLAYGWVEGGYTGASTGPGLLRVQPRLNRFGDEFLLNQVGLILKKPIRQDALGLGFSAIFLAGADAALEQPKGGIDSPPGNPRFGLDFPELAVDAHLPILTDRGMDVKLGRMMAIIGYSCVLAPYRPLSSGDYQFYYAQDTAFTGLLTNLHLSDRISIYNGLALGANTFFTTRGDRSYNYIGQVNAWLTEERRTLLTGSMALGPDALLAAPGLSGDFLTMVELRVQQNWSPAFTQVVQSNMGWDAGTAVGTGSFYGLNTILIHHATPRLDAIARADWFADPEGTRTGFDTDYLGLTLGINWHPTPSLELRPEIRADFAGDPAFGIEGSPGGRTGQLTGGISLLGKF